MEQVDFRALFDAIPSPYMVLDRELRYVAANPAYQRVTMRSLDELLGGRIFDLFPNEGDSGRRLRQSFERVLETAAPDTIAYIPYAIARPDEQGGGLDQRYWTAVHTPLLNDRGEVAFIIQNTVDVTEIVRLREATSLPFRMAQGEPDLLERAREAERARERLLEEADDFRRLFQQAPGMIAVLSGPDHVYTFVNDACRRFVGGREIIGMRVRDAFPDAGGQAIFDILDEVYRTGTPRSGEAVRLMVRQQPDEPLRETFIDVSCAPVFGADGKVTGIFAQGMDRTEGVRAQERQRLLLDELNHRVKNTLATVQSIAMQTLRSHARPEAARAVFMARIMALAQTHNLLSRSHWTGAELHDLLAQQLTPYGVERSRLEGPIVRLPPRSALTLSMVFHELATNAGKYGALSDDGGCVEVSWGLRRDIERTRWLWLRWQERDGPPIRAPVENGFGSRLIRLSVEGELGGTADLRFEPEGAVFRGSLPLPDGGR